MATTINKIEEEGKVFAEITNTNVVKISADELLNEKTRLENELNKINQVLDAIK